MYNSSSSLVSISVMSQLPCLLQLGQSKYDDDDDDDDDECISTIRGQ